MSFDHRLLDAKWQQFWKEHDTFRTSADRDRPKYYVLDMFPYPSGSGLHVGHPKGYTATDVVARARRMMGYNVLRVMGWDSFGLPAERQAEKEDKHPREVTERNIATFRSQLDRLGLSYDWSREIATSDPSYYRWTQWIFLQLYQKGLAYQAEVPVNWCPALGTVLANEEVVDGRYVETGDPVERRLMKQWMLRITDYAESLVQGLDSLDWPEGIKAMQREWIGRSEGARFRFRVQGQNAEFEVFTTRPDTLFGCTYTVLAPEHPLVPGLTTPEQAESVGRYVEQAGKRSDRDRSAQAVDAPKTGVFTGSYAIHPVTGAAVPIWVADYVLGHYGTGAVFACPAHDERDHAFARTFGLPIVEVVRGGADVQVQAYTGDGPHVHSDFLDGLEIVPAKRAIIKWFEEHGIGRGTVQYRLRDWLFSRQRYWGEPFPLIELEDGTIRALDADDLPVLLPELENFKPTADGRPPLARAKEWVQTVDPQTMLPARRETNTMPQWAGSCWYYLRFISPGSAEAAWDPTEERYWMPVDLYVGGAEHAVLHLLYSRFWHHVLHDLGLVSTREPFQRLFNQGMVHALSYREILGVDDAGQTTLGKYHYPTEVETRQDGVYVKGTEIRCHTQLEKMSKSRYNVENPDDVCDVHGADALRLYELFMGPLDVGAQWETHGVAGTRRFLDRSWRLVLGEAAPVTPGAVADPELDRALHRAIKAVSESVETLKFNTAISEMMIFVNTASKAPAVGVEQVSAFVKILAPFAPHVAEELWERLGHGGGISLAPWPQWDLAKLEEDTVTLVVQVNGKTRSKVVLPKAATSTEAIAAAKADPDVARFLTGVDLVREVFVPGRLVNFVVK
jgi:leucyl-tRNA synthetase